MARFRNKLKEDVLALALPAGRLVGSEGHAKARRYILRREKLNYAKMERMMRYLVALTEAVATEELCPHNGGPVDTAAFERRHIEKACGILFPLVLKLLGAKKLQARSDIDEMWQSC